MLKSITVLCLRYNSLFELLSELVSPPARKCVSYLTASCGLTLQPDPGVSQPAEKGTQVIHQKEYFQLKTLAAMTYFSSTVPLSRTRRILASHGSIPINQFLMRCHVHFALRLNNSKSTLNIKPRILDKCRAVYGKNKMNRNKNKKYKPRFES